VSGEVQSLQVPAEHDGTRLDLFLVASLPGASRGVVRRLLEQGAVRVGGQRRKKGALVRAGEVVEVDGYVRPDQWSPRPDPTVPITVLYKDQDLIAVDKPAGMACHPLVPDEVGTVASGLVAAFPEVCRAGDVRREAALVHRLDSTTSGVLIFARRRRSFRDLVSQMRGQGGAVKTYDALVEGDASSVATIDLPLTSRNKRVVVSSSPSTDGGPPSRPASTLVRAVRRLGEHTLVEVEIGAGQRHQIRAHLAAVGHPIVGDSLYGARTSLGLVRPFLHARRVHLRSPSSGEPLCIEAPLADDLTETLGRLERGEADQGGG